MKVASIQRNRRKRKLARKKRSDSHQAKSRLRKMRGRDPGQVALARSGIFDGRLIKGRPFFPDASQKNSETEQRQNSSAYFALVVCDYNARNPVLHQSALIPVGQRHHSAATSVR